MSVGVMLAPRDPTALAAFTADVSNPSSPLFRHYLARGAFAARFGPTLAVVRRIEQFFARAGLAPGSLSPNHLLLMLRGSAAQFERAFRVQLESVRLGDGELGSSTKGGLWLPAQIARRVNAVVGLDNLAIPHALGTGLERVGEGARRLPRFFGVRPRAATGGPSACIAAASTAVTDGGITDDQVSHAYGADGLYGARDLAAGQTIAIYELEPFSMADLAAFDECYFGVSHTSEVQVIPIDGGVGAGAGSGEAAIDVETVSALAPNAHIKVYEAPSTTYGFVDGYNAIVEADTAKVVSTSWGECEQALVSFDPGDVAAENVLFEQAAAQGQTVFAAAGDNGNNDCGKDYPPGEPLVSVDDPASQPYVVGVGGTTPLTLGQPPKERVWNDKVAGGGTGGGISTLWTAMPWQRKAIVNKSDGATCNAPVADLCRTVPDVSGFADGKTGLTIYYEGAWGTIGGTSIAAPMWAAMLAEINASAVCESDPATRGGVGFAAPLLYEVAANRTDYAAGFTDVTVGNNDVLGDTGDLYPAGPGYDLATGWGSPEVTTARGIPGPGLADSMCAAARGTTTPTITSVHPSSGAVQGGTPFTITGTGFVSGGAPDVSSVNFGTSSASFRVLSNWEIVGTTGPDTDTTRDVLTKLNGRSGTVLLTVTTPHQGVVRGPAFHYHDDRASRAIPEVLQVGPSGGRASGGTSVDIYGTGFTSATRVTFGGAPAAAFRIRSNTQILAIAPAADRVRCAVKDPSALGLCQVQVRVTGPGGTSGTAPIFKPFTGNLDFNSLDIATAPQHCSCEVYPSVSEFDYVTKLRLYNVFGPDGKPYEDNPAGNGAVLTLRGVGLNVLTLNWVNVGEASLQDSAVANFVYFGDGTSLKVFSPADPNPTDVGNRAPVSVDSVVGVSDAKWLRFGPVQQVDSVSSEIASTTGGQSLVLRGGGFVRVNEILWVPDLLSNPEITQFTKFTVKSKRQIELTTPPLAPGSYQVYVCGSYSCGASGPTDDLWTDTVTATVPGGALVTSAEATGAPATGPVAGGTTFEVQGTDFGPLAQLTVQLINGNGSPVTATSVSAGPAPTDPGATETLIVQSPPSFGGLATIDSVVVTGANGTSPLNDGAEFTYTY
jgi:hypothetical protein